MKLKYYSIIVALGLSLASISVTSCKDDMTEQLRGEARIEAASFTVTGTGLTFPTKEPPVFRTSLSEDGHTFYIRVPENYDPQLEIKGVTPRFTLSMAATVEPAMSVLQDFSDLDNPVVYTVTSADGSVTETYKVTYLIVPPTQVEKGTGFTASEMTACKTYVELGFPGTYASWTYQPSDVLNVSMGDLIGMPAFCGNEIVIFSRSYAWGNSAAVNGVPAFPADHSQAFKVFTLPDMEPAGELNLGGISPGDVVAVTSDAAGHMVAAVGRKAGGSTTFYYWTSTTEEPIELGSVDVSTEIGNHDADAGSYLNVAGDVTDQAVMTAAAPRSDEGQHYKFRVAGGRLIPGYDVISTGHSSNDKAWFQMVSFFGPGEYDPYLCGDTEDMHMDNGQINVYLQNSDGSNRGTMDYHKTGVNGWTHDDGEQWWSRSGMWLARGGGRRPTVHAMTINGVPYSFFTTGSDWRVRGVLMEQNLDKCVTFGQSSDYPFPHFGYGKTTAAKSPRGDGGMWIGQSYGAMADWMYDEEEMVGYVAVWSDRFGIHLFKLTCLEL